MNAAPFTCRRQLDYVQFGMGMRGQAGEDTWRGDGTCSYCGSLSPEAFFHAIDTGARIIPTDKNYKVYVGTEHRSFYFQHLSEHDQDRFIAIYNRRLMNFAYPGYLYVTPFFCRQVVPPVTA